MLPMPETSRWSVSAAFNGTPVPGEAPSEHLGREPVDERVGPEPGEVGW